MSELRVLGNKSVSIQMIGATTVGGKYESGLLWQREFSKSDSVTRQARSLLIKHAQCDVERVRHVRIYAVNFQELRLPVDKNSSIEDVRIAAKNRGYALLTLPTIIFCFLSMRERLKTIAACSSIYFLSSSFVSVKGRNMIFRAEFPTTLPVFGAAEAPANKKIWKPEHKFVVASQ